MSAEPAILAIDQGTTSSRAIVFDRGGNPRANAQREFPQIFPDDGWVEHDPESIWSTTLDVARSAYTQAVADGLEVVALGITNQRETSVLWERDTGRPIHNAIVWQDRRTAAACHALRDRGQEPVVTARTGLLLDPYFSATKVTWILDKVDDARQRAQAGELAFGTIDSFLIFRLTGGQRHVTDATNASRTNLYNIHNGAWDPDLLDLFDVPDAVLPKVLDCAADFGTTEPGLFGRPIPILGVAGDQQAATVGQCCFEPGSIKSTYGTGCFVVLNTGDRPAASKHRLLTTIAYQLDGQRTYGLEGSIFVAGSAVQWLRDKLEIIEQAGETETVAQQLDQHSGVYLVPAFTGLGAPHWDPDARGALLGMTLDTGRAEVVKATLESVCYQTHDLFSAMAADGMRPPELKVDGGMVANNWLMQRLASILGIPVERPVVMETTALGVAYLAGLQAGLYSDLAEIASRWQRDRRFEPSMDPARRDSLLSGWRSAVRRVTADL